MEESEKRRERLRAMRMEAAQVDATGNGDGPSLPSCLSNPLIENSATTLSPARFGFYTDPMAAFSSTKRKSNSTLPSYIASPTSQMLSNGSGTSNPESIPASQFQRDHMQGRGHVNQAIPMAGEFYQQHPHPVPSPSSGWNVSTMHGWAPRLGHGPSPQSGFIGSPNLFTGPVLDRGPTFSWVPRPSFTPSPRSGYPGNPSPSPRPGRGRGNWSGTDTGRGSGRWVSSRGHGLGIGNSTRAEGFYDKSMIEDPWKFLEPVVWKNVSHSSKFRDLELASKRPRASNAWSQSSSQPSLAEYLAASFNEALDGSPSS